jgi:hypothetical protein
MYLNPRLPEKLSGTALNYKFRGEQLVIGLDKGLYSVFNSQFKLSTTTDFGFHTKNNELEYFHSNDDVYSLKAQLAKTGKLSVEIVKWNEKECVWNQIVSPNERKITYSVCQLKADNLYAIFINGQNFKTLKSNDEGSLKFDVNTKTDSVEIRIQLLNQ